MLESYLPTPKLRWKAQSSAYRAYQRRLRLDREACEYADTPSCAMQQLRHVPFVTAPIGYSRPVPPMFGFGLDRFRVGMAANIWVRKHATRLGIRIATPYKGWVHGDELADYIIRLRRALTSHLSKCAMGAVDHQHRQMARAA